MSLVRIPVEAREPYEVCVGPGALREAARALLPFSTRALLSDENVAPLYAARLELAPSPALLALPPGEDSKRFAVLERVLDFMVAAGLERRSCLIALGGGVVGDLGGLAAALYQRGIAVVQCPTTLLAQVDASVGGKTAVNLAAGKNLAGALHQPAAVLADTATLASLPEVEYRSGLGEVVKTALIAGEAVLALLEREVATLARRDPDVLARVVEACVRTKAAIVARDEAERGERRLLNLGHTFGHAIEHAAGYGAVPHGLAVAAGIGLALECSRRIGLLRDPDLPERVRRLCRGLGLPDGLAALRASAGLALDGADLLTGMRHDKKGPAGRPRLVLPVAAGAIEYDVELRDGLLAELLA